ncbi:hypothetical protein ACFQO1_11310 [Jejudonia soesokkakensis]|uniref:DUF5666 domain-containing protein n=1 Tax=Jejudonia soesokkakensis TaxID=1323432 RepID=A0ABW2MU99_9FLAO
MKTILSLILLGIALTVGILLPKSGSLSEKDTITVTFDGYEGEYYFFSDKNFKAIQLTERDELPIKASKLREGDYVGSTFTIKASKVIKKDTYDASVSVNF